MRSDLSGPNFRSGSFDPTIEGFRGFSILAVLVYHAFAQFRSAQEYIQSESNSIIYLFTDMGGSGVDLFFILSGFLITRNLINTLGSKGFFLNFYARRALRILPLYYFALGFLLYIYPGLAADPWTRENQIYFWTYLQNFVLPSNPGTSPQLTHFWSLAIEEQFYLVWPIVIFLFSLQTIKKLAWFSIPLFIVVRFFMIHHYGMSFSVMVMHSLARVDRFLLGAGLAIALHHGLRLENYRRSLKFVLGTSVFLLVLNNFSAISLAAKFQIHLVLLAIVGITGLAVALIKEKNFLRSKFFLGNRYLQNLGAYSYGVYILHLPIMYQSYHWFFQHFPNSSTPGPFARLLFLIFTGGLSFILARITWVAIEAPFLRLKQRFQ
jgi:peptidoglycan/LPS O-acetylase OafA/YrhL